MVTKRSSKRQRRQPGKTSYHEEQREIRPCQDADRHRQPERRLAGGSRVRGTESTHRTSNGREHEMRTESHGGRCGEERSRGRSCRGHHLQFKKHRRSLSQRTSHSMTHTTTQVSFYTVTSHSRPSHDSLRINLPSAMATQSVRMWSATTRYAMSTPSTSSLPTYRTCT